MKQVFGIVILVAVVLTSGTTSRGEETYLSWSYYLDHKYMDEVGYGIVIDPRDNTPCVAGRTFMVDFPTTEGAFDTTHGGANYEVFVAKFNPTGSDLIYSTFIGGLEDDIAYDIAMDDSGYVYVTGETFSSGFPITSGSLDNSYNGLGDTFVSKLNATGTDLLYSTFLGGTRSDRGRAIDIDESGNAYVVGTTSSEDFPTTSGALDTTFNGGSSVDGGTDIFVVKINPSGSGLEYGTYIGGSDDERGGGIATFSPSGRVFVTGNTMSPDFPVTSTSFDTAYNGKHDVVVTNLDSSGASLGYSTFLGGSQNEQGNDIAVDHYGNVYVTGLSYSANFPTSPECFDSTHNGWDDVILFKLTPNGRTLAYSTFLGGELYEGGQSIALDDSNHVYLTGTTYSPDFPITNGAFDSSFFGGGSGAVYVSKLTHSGRILSYSTFLKGPSKGLGIDVDQHGQAYVTGWTSTIYFPITSGAFDTTFGPWDDAFVTKLDDTGSSLVFSTFLGGGWIDTVGISELPVAVFPTSYVLHQNYPNPFNSTTEIRYRIPADGHVTLKIYNTLGQQVRILMDTDQSPGEHIIHWDGRDEGGQEVSSGLYFCRLQVGDFTKTIKMMLVK